MVPLNLLSKLVPRPPLGTLVSRSLRTSQGTLKQCEGGGSKHRDTEDVCQESRPCKSVKKKKSKLCDKMRSLEVEDSKSNELPDMCSKQALMDCAHKLEDLQKKWEALARTAERVEAAAAQRAGGGKRASGCPVKPPSKPEKEGSSTPIVLSLLAVIVGVAYYLYTQSQEGEGGEGEGDKEKKEK